MQLFARVMAALSMGGAGIARPLQPYPDGHKSSFQTPSFVPPTLCSTIHPQAFTIGCAARLFQSPILGCRHRLRMMSFRSRLSLQPC